jgi:hypothetical protein
MDGLDRHDLWFAARQIIVEAESQLVLPISKAGRLLIDFGPIFLGVIPILLAALAQLQSIPELPKASESMLQVGSVLRIQARELAINAKALRWMAGALCLAALTLVAFTWWLAGKTGGMAAAFNQNYFSKPITLLVTVVMITLTAALFVESPVVFPQFVKLFGIVAIFAICVSSFVVHMTLLTDRYRITFFPIILIFSAAIAALVLNDNLGSSKDSTSLSFDRTDLRSTFYRLPLGWSLSPKTRNIIAHESGRYWDCEPRLKYTQTRTFPFLSVCPKSC